MSSLAREIILTELSIPSTSGSPCKGQRDVSIHRPATSIRATARFCGQFEGHYMSFTLLEKALGSQLPRGRSGVCLVVQATWHFAVFDQGSETSHLRVVPELGHDVVFGRGAGCGSSWRNAPVNQQPLCRNSSNEAPYHEGWLRLLSVVEELTRLDDSRLGRKLADDSFIRLFASSCGFELQGELAVKAFAELLRHRVEATRHGHPPAGDNPPLLPRTSTPGALSFSEETDSSVSSGFDECDLAYQGSITSNEMTFERSLHQTPPFPRGTSQMCVENVPNTSIPAAQVMRDPSSGNSTGSWSVVEDPSPKEATIEDDSLAQAGRAETEEDDGYAPQVSDFDMHPGHKFWVWDKDRQRWRRRGRSGLEETDWFPESFA